MPSLSEMVALALRNRGKICGVHLDLMRPVIRFGWARVCKTDEEAEMVECPLESAAVPGEPYGLLFEGITNYLPDNQDNLQVGYLADLRVSGESLPQRCVVRFDSSFKGGKVEFDFIRWSVLITPARDENLV